MAKRSRSRRSRSRGGASENAQEVDFAQEYHYVIADLKRFGLLALGMLALLIVLALVI